MPARVFKYGMAPQRIRTFLILFAIALSAPLLGLAAYGLNRMASLEQAEIERRVVQVAEDLAMTLIANSIAPLQCWRRSPHRSPCAAATSQPFTPRPRQRSKATNAAIVLIDRELPAARRAP